MVYKLSMNNYLGFNIKKYDLLVLTSTKSTEEFVLAIAAR